jgi:hypothetical protein
VAADCERPATTEAPIATARTISLLPRHRRIRIPPSYGLTFARPSLILPPLSPGTRSTVRSRAPTERRPVGDGVREVALQSFDPQPEHRRRLALATLPLVDHGFGCLTNRGSKLLLAQAEPVPQANECGRIIRRHSHATHRHETTPPATIRPATPRRHEARRGRSRAERRGEPPIMRSSPQRPHMNVEFVCQDSEFPSASKRIWPSVMTMPWVRSWLRANGGR